MGLNKPEQDLKRDLQGVASDLTWSAVDLLHIAERLSLASNGATESAPNRDSNLHHNYWQTRNHGQNYRQGRRPSR